MTIQKVEEFLNNNIDRIAGDANRLTYETIEGYKKNNIPPEESADAIKKLIRYVSANILKQNHIPDGNFIFDVVSFEDGIASKRVEYRLNLIDLMQGIGVAKSAIWKYLQENSDQLGLDIPSLFQTERRINDLIEKFTIAVTEKFLTIKDALIESQNTSLKMWEEIVKSTSYLNLKIPCKGEFALIARAQAEAIAKRLNFDRDSVSDLVLSVGEACDNAVEHGYSEKGINIQYTICDKELTVEVRDYGKGFDPEGKGKQLPDLFAERGRGIYIMKSISDSVDIKSEPGKGTSVTIRKKRTNYVPQCLPSNN